MIPDWLAETAGVLMQGPLLFLLGLVAELLLLGFAYGIGRRRGRGEQSRWHVVQGIRWAVRPRTVELVPGQRRGEP